MVKPLLVIFTGVPGSGKTYFALRLADKISALRLNSDAMRLAIFGSLENIEATYHSPRREMLNTHTFGAMDYAATQALSMGTSVVYEAIQQTIRDRRHMEELARVCDAQLVLVSVVVDLETAIARTMQREAADDARQFYEQKAREVVMHFNDTFEPLERTDYTVEIDGTLSFNEQYRVFQQKVDRLNVI